MVENTLYHLEVCGGGKTNGDLYFGVKSEGEMRAEVKLSRNAFHKVRVPVIFRRAQYIEVLLMFYRKNSHGNIYNATASRRQIQVTAKPTEPEESWWSWCVLL